MKRIDLLRQKDKLYREINQLKKINADSKYSKKSIQINERIKLLRKKYNFTVHLLEASEH